jgi:uncharacterized protein YggT (Ycf19 family)
MNAFIEIAFGMVFIVGLLYIGQLLVGIFNWPAREDNPVYRFFRFLTSPVTKLVRIITPAKIADKHVPVVAFFLLFWIYVGLFFLRVCNKFPHLCQAIS